MFGLLLPRLYLVKFGSDVNGLDNTIKNIFAYLALLEAGVGLSAQYALYSPVAKGETDKINGILAATRSFYLKSGVIYTLISLVFAAIYPIVAKTTLDYFTVFSMFFANLQKIVTSFTDGLTFRLGQMYHTDKERFHKFFSGYESLCYMLLFTCYTVVTAFLMPIIRLYTSGIADAAIYDSQIVLFLFAAVTVLSGTEIPMQQALNIAGKFDETKHQAVLEMSINIAVSLIATWRLGMIGCLVGTVAALLYRNNALILYVSKKVLQRSSLQNYKRITVNLLTAAAVIFFLGTESCEAVSYIYVAARAFVNAIWIALLFAAVNFLTDWRAYISVLKELKNYKNKRGEK